MKQIYQGKTKDVYQLDANQLKLIFKDDVTGQDGQFDPGANQVGLTIKGMGRSNLLMSTYFFQELATADIATHWIRSDLSANAMFVQAAEPFGQGVEVIYRRRAVGSFLRRYGRYIKSGDSLDDYVEFTIKDDSAGDPLITDQGLVQLGIMTAEEINHVRQQTQVIGSLLSESCAAKGLELYDLKLEFGRSRQSGAIILMDELSAGNMRVYKDGQAVEPLELFDYFFSRPN